MNLVIADVSSHQTHVDFDVMKSAGVSGCIIRAGYRTYGTGKLTTDTCFSQHAANAQKAGMLSGLYWYTAALSTAEAQAEADYFLALAKSYVVPCAWLDLEFSPIEKGRADKIGAGNRTDYAITWLEAVKRAGYQVGVYCNLDFWTNNLVSSRLAPYHLWLARYSDTKPSVSCDLWQFTSSAQASLYGVTSLYAVGSLALDLSYCYSPAVVSSAESKEKSTLFDLAQLQRGDRGQQVCVLQHYLNVYYIADGIPLSIDGVFGAKTAEQVKHYQREQGLSADGIVGAKTWGKLLGCDAP